MHVLCAIDIIYIAKKLNKKNTRYKLKNYFNTKKKIPYKKCVNMV